MPPWQTLGVREGMAKRADGKWAAYEVGILVSRQNGKNGCIEVVELGWMVNEPGIRILHTAHEFQTAVKSMEKLIALFRSDPLLEALLPKRGGIRRGNGRESITLTNGSTIHFRTRTNQGGRGGSFDRLVVDEAMICSPAAIAALMPLLTTADRPGSGGPGGQIWYLGSAADSDSQEHCGQWASLRERALAGTSDNLLWLEWSAPDPPQDASRKQLAAWRENRAHWAAANPSLGYLLTEEFIENELETFRANLEKWEIERLSVGRWPKPPEEHEPVVDMTIWGRMGEQNPAVYGPIVLSLDMNGDRTVCALGAATRARRRDGEDERIRVEIGYYGSPRDILERVVDLVDRWDPHAIVINGSSPAAALAPRLLEFGIEVELTSAAQAAQAAGGFVDDALGGRLSHANDDRLTESLAGAHKRPMSGGTFGWDYQASDVLAVQVASLARWGLLTFGAATPPPASPSRGGTTTTAHSSNSSELNVHAAAF